MNDRSKGMFYAAFLGDALGAPHEFYCNRGVVYTGKLQHRAFYNSRYQGRQELAVGQVTDDSEMTITLLRSLIANSGYHKDKVIESYIRWANSGLWMMGRNTRNLFKGVTTIKGYQKRLDQNLQQPVDQWTQSNGALMRCSPLALLNDDQCIIDDASITNPSPVCIDCNLIYVNMLRMLLSQRPEIEIFCYLESKITTKEVAEVFQQIRSGTPRSVKENKGWCLHGLYLALKVLLSADNYTNTIAWVIAQGGDTDTNGCIAGAVWGAKNGFDRLQQEQRDNLEILINCPVAEGPTPRDPIYQIPTDILGGLN